MVQIIKGIEVTRPTTTPLKSSVLDHAVVVENRQFGLQNNEGLWPSYNCLDTLVPTPLCPNPLEEPAPFKTFANAEWQPAFEFAVHGGVQCQAVGLDVEDMRAEIGRVYGLNEGKGVEMALAANRFVATDSDAPVQWDGPVEVTSAPVSPLEALARLEGFAASIYAGVPTLHMPRAVGTLLGDKIVWEGDKAYTRMGSKVAFGGGYDDPDTFGGPWTIYATGEVYVEKSQLVNLYSYTLPGDGSGTGSDENGLTDNTVIALVERMYRVAVDCFVASAQTEVQT